VPWEVVSAWGIRISFMSLLRRFCGESSRYERSYPFYRRSKNAGLFSFIQRRFRECGVMA